MAYHLKPTSVHLVAFLLLICGCSCVRDLNDLRSLKKTLSLNKFLISLAIDGYTSGKAFANVSKPCSKQISASDFLDKLFKYLDAIGKPGSGYMNGNIYWVGSYEECRDIKDSHYCMAEVHIKIPLPFPINTIAFLGICSPSQCNEEDVILLFGIIMKALKLQKLIYIPRHTNFKFPIGKSIVCHKEIKSSTGTYITVILCVLIMLLCLAGTATELLHQYFTTERENEKPQPYISLKAGAYSEDLTSDDESFYSKSSSVLKNAPDSDSQGHRVTQVLISFSIIQNTKIAMSTDVPKDAITSLNGICFVSLVWIISKGVTKTVAYVATDNVLVSLRDSRKFSAMPENNADLAFDSLFVSTGILVAYLGMRKFDANGKLSLLSFYLRRILRLTPVYVVVILFYIYIFPQMGEGPMWPTMVSGEKVNACLKYWWTNLLYINNFYPGYIDDLCLEWSWYLAIHMQFYLISPLFLYAMHVLKPRGIAITLGLTVLISFILTAFLTGFYDLKTLKKINPADQSWVNEVRLREIYVYTKPYCRIAPYLIGLLFGYIIHRELSLKWRFKRVIAIFGLFVAITLCLLLVFGTLPYYKAGHHPPTRGVNIAYETFYHFVWGAAIAWLTYICYFGFAGLINDILSWRAFVPLRRLSYGAFLVHGLVIYMFYYSRSTIVNYSRNQLVIFTMASVVMSYMCSFLLTIFIELPSRNLANLI